MNLKRLIPKYDGGGKTLDVNQIQRVIDHYSGGKSPLKAQDFINVSKKYGVPVQLLLSQSILESNIGTKGAAVRTRNVANVGNTATGKRTYHNSFVDGLDRFAKLMATEYQVRGTEDVMRLIKNNFQRPVRGGYYDPTNPNYGATVHKLIQKIDKGGNWGAPVTYSNQSNGDYGNTGYNIPLKKAELIDDTVIKNALAQGMNEEAFNYINNNIAMLPRLEQGTMDWYNDYKKYKDDLAFQEEERKRIEIETNKLLAAVNEKAIKNQNFLNSIPNYNGVSSVYRDGGMLRNVHPDIIQFHKELKPMFPWMRVTSGYRPGARTSSGKRSRHAIGQAIDIAADPRLQQFFYSAEGDALLRKYKLGFLDESLKNVLAKTKGSGPHYHIGKDFLGNGYKLNTAYKPISSVGKSNIGYSAGKTNGSYIDSDIAVSDDYYNSSYDPGYFPNAMDVNPVNVVGTQEHFDNFLRTYASAETSKQEEIEEVSKKNAELAQQVKNNKAAMLSQFKRFMPSLNYISSSY